jgi:hypothetical protein
LGGKGHEFIVELLSVPASDFGQADDGVFADADQACGLANTAAIGEVLENCQELVVRQATIEERSAFAFGEAILAAIAVKQPVLLRTIATTNGEVLLAPLAIQRAFGVLAAETA